MPKNGEFEPSEMLQRSFYLGIESLVNYVAGGTIGEKGFGPSKHPGIRGVAMRTFMKTPYVLPMNLVLDTVTNG